MKAEIGKAAPSFSAADQNGIVRHLSEYRGKWLLLYFYPKDFTPGCTVEAEQFRDHFDELKRKAVILGVSTDSSESHKKFCNKYGLQFDLIADIDKKIIGAYGADGTAYARRASFLINPDGIVVKTYDKVTPELHAQEILRDITMLQGK